VPRPASSNAREHVLARAGLAFEQDARVGRRDALEHAEDRAHREAVAERFAELGRLARQDDGLARLDAHAELDAAHADGRAGLDHGFVHGGAADARVVGRAQIAHEDALGAPFELAMLARDGVVAQDEIIFGRFTDAEPIDEPDAFSAFGAVQHDDDDVVRKS
jgi:hypothetical protein